MKVPLETTFRGVKETDEIKELIGKKVTKPEEISDYILAVIEREDAFVQRKLAVTQPGTVKFRMS